MSRNAGASLLLALCCLAVVGCGTAPARRDPTDPFERVNRVTFKFNEAVDHAVLRPVARTYKKVTPQPIRTGVSNFFDNISYPVTTVNDLLQLKLKAFGLDVLRLVTNTTIGIGGIFDPASKAGLPKNEEDFGQTLGYWGAKPGPYIVIPLLGPSDVRDGIGRVADFFTDPRHYIRNPYIEWSLWAVGVVDLRYRLLDADQALDNAFDRYSFLRTVYLQRRQYLVTDGKGADKQDEKQELDEEKRILEESGEPEPKPQPRDDSTVAPPPPPLPDPNSGSGQPPKGL